MRPASFFTGQVALVTGANKGIGKEIARGLARCGMTVLLGARDPERGKRAAAELSGESRVLFIQLDVTDDASITAAAKQIATEFGKLDVLVNNAGIVVGGRHKPSEFTVAEMRETFETNVFGVVAVTHAMLPLLRQSPAARIVNISSLRGSLASAIAFNGHPNLGYYTSKTALNAITVQYGRELASTAIKINAAVPGYCATDLNDHNAPGTAEQGAVIAIRLATLGEDGPSGGLFDENGPIPW
jgi:NAD(P)-dependent dehydrogenase (short-subunit alcohol dehydrogenase family)